MFPRVISLNPPYNMIPKIIGMFIDQELLTIEEIIRIIEVDDILKKRMEEAMKVIEKIAQNNQYITEINRNIINDIFCYEDSI